MTVLSVKEWDFTDCRYDPRKKNFPDTISKEIPAFDGFVNEHREPVFRYIVMLYDKKSPLWESEPEYFQRKILAANLSKMPKSETGGWSMLTRGVLESTDEEVNKLIVSFLASLGDPDYMMLIAELTMLNSLLFGVVSNKFDNNTHKSMTALSDGVRMRTRKIFGSGDKDELDRIRILLYESAEKDRQRLNPEAIVKLLDEQGDFPRDWGPYGKDYSVEPIKFYQDEHTEG